MSSPLCKYIDENNIDIPFVSFDTYEEIKKYIKKGIISATIAQNVEKQMESAFECLVKHIITGEASLKTVYTDVQHESYGNDYRRVPCDYCEWRRV